MEAKGSENSDISDQISQSQSDQRQKKKPRFQVCENCELYFQTDQPHDCITALKERVEKQENQISGMLTKEDLVQIMKGYVTQELFMNYVKTSELKFSELFGNQCSSKLPQNLNNDQIECPNGHFLTDVPRANQLLLSIVCDVCLKKITENINQSINCKKCNFDVCLGCKKDIKLMKCPNAHQLNFQNVEKNTRLLCNRCNQGLKQQEISYSCSTCDYDLCRKCFQIAVSHCH